MDVEGPQSISFSFSEGDQTSFHDLSISGCPNLVSIELPALNFDCYISHCKNLKWLSHKPASFQPSTLEDCPELIFSVQGLPSILSTLSIPYSDKLASQMELNLQGQASLRRFSIRSGCECLKAFPKEGLLPSTSLQSPILGRTAAACLPLFSNNPELSIAETSVLVWGRQRVAPYTI